jgi:hypothetical protein
MEDLEEPEDYGIQNGAKETFYDLITQYEKSPTQANFANIILNGWIVLESYVNNLVIIWMGISPFLYDGDEELWNSKINLLEALDFQTKILFLKEKKVVSLEEYQAIGDFQQERNRLYHATRANKVFDKIMLPQKQKELIEISRKAFDSIYEAVMRHSDNDATI